MGTAALEAGRPTWAEVDLAAIAENYISLRSLLDSPSRGGQPGAGQTPPALQVATPIPRLIPVIKADAYGHGAIPVARALAKAGAEIFAVALVEEGAALRAAGIAEEILVLEGAWPGQEEELIRLRLTPAVNSPAGIRRLDKAACDAGVHLPVHLKLDTGMVRLGFWWEDLREAVAVLSGAGGIRVCGTFSHLACADEDDRSFTLEQMRRFSSAVGFFRASGIDPGELHLANSAGLLHFPETRCFSVRPGIALYGYSASGNPSPVRLRQPLTLKSRICRTQSIGKGTSVGYNRRFVAQRRTIAGTVPVGYADGYRRSLMDNGRVIVRDRWAAVLGAVSMDMIVVDLTDIPDAGEGDEVLLLGSSANCRMDAADWASRVGSISYEILCGISGRVPRRYINATD